MLEFITGTKINDTDRMNRCGYFRAGSELVLFNVGTGTYDAILQSNILQKKSKINIFISEISEDTCGDLSKIILYCYENVYQHDMSCICVYFPDQNLTNYLALQKVSEKCYNYYVNIWDELFINNSRKEIQYEFFQLGFKDNKYVGTSSYYGIEVSIKNGENFYYGTDYNPASHRLDNIYAYDWIYERICSDEQGEFTYQKLLELAKNIPSKERRRICIIDQGSSADCMNAQNDGFTIV